MSSKTGKKKAPKKPAKLTVGTIHARPIRGPKEDKWYWRAERYEGSSSKTVWTGWGTSLEVERQLATMLLTGQEKAPKGKVDTVETLGDLFELWKAVQEDRLATKEIAPRSLLVYSQCLKKLDRLLGRVPIHGAQKAVWEGYKRTRLVVEEGAPRTVYTEFSVLRWVWEFAQENGLAPEKELKLPKIVVKKDEHIYNHYTPSEEEVWKVINASEGWLKVFVTLLAYTGARFSEVADITWDKLDLHAVHPTITVTGKTGTRVIPLTLHAELIPTLMAHPRTGERVFEPAHTTMCTAMSGENLLGQVCMSVGVPLFTAHGLRRFCENTLAEAGVDIVVYCAWLGHSPVVALQHYRMVRPNALRKAAQEVRLRAEGEKEGKVIPFAPKG